MILAAYRFLYKRLLQDLSVNNNRLSIPTQSDSLAGLFSPQFNAQGVQHILLHLSIDIRASVARYLNSLRRRDIQLVQNGAHQPSVPQERLRGQIIDTKRAAQSNIRHSLPQRKVFTEERNENIASRPVFDVCICIIYILYALWT